MLMHTVRFVWLFEPSKQANLQTATKQQPNPKVLSITYMTIFEFSLFQPIVVVDVFGFDFIFIPSQSSRCVCGSLN